MRSISSISNSRLFRLLLLFTAIMFPVFLVYQSSKPSQPEALVVHEPSPRRLVHPLPNGGVRIDPNMLDKLRVKGTENKSLWKKRRDKVATTSANATAGVGTERLGKLKQQVAATRIKTNVVKCNPPMGDSRPGPLNFPLNTNNEAGKLVETQEKDHDSDVSDASSEGTSKDKSKRPIFIVILARMRTGSTLIGEIFNQNPSLFFMYEPLISIDPLLRSGKVKVSDHQSISTDLLLGYSQCHFQENLTQAWLKWNGGTVRSTKLVPFCKPSPRPRSTYRNCSVVTVDNVRSVCEKYHQRLCVKTIRADLDYLKPLVDAGVNVKIIHLVRDPRGTANSRKLYYNYSRPNLKPPQPRKNLKGKLDILGLLGDYPDHVVHTIPRLCQWTRDSIRQVQAKPSWLRNRYKLIRYEDFALEPLRIARQIYDFIGIEFPRVVMEWIAKNTRIGDGCSNLKTFSTHKNSVETASRWRQSLRPLQVRQVEGICKETMELLGYKTAVNMDDIANSSVNLLDPLPIPDTF